MMIIGIDPGSIRVGYAVLEVDTPRYAMKLCDMGVWELMRPIAEGPIKKDMPLGDRLEKLSQHVSALVTEWNPRFIGLEKAVHFKNAASVQVLAEARGVIRLVLHQELESAHERLFELSPTLVKKVASGFGAASKTGVLRSMELRFPELKKLHEKNDFHFDAFDALAIALSTWTQVKKTQLLRSTRPQQERHKEL